MSCRCQCPKKNVVENFFLKFSGALPPTQTSDTSYLMDGLPVKASLVGYPVVLAFTAKKLKVNLTGAGLGPAASARIRLLRDGLPVPGFEITYGGLNPTSGVQTTATFPEVFTTNQLYDLEVVTAGLTADTVFLSANLEVARKT